MDFSKVMDMGTGVPIFISYASLDVDPVKELVANIEERGYSCWYANRDIRSSAQYNTVINEQINNCEIMIVMVTPNVEHSEFVPKEISLAYEKKNEKKPTVLPILWNVDSYPSNVSLFLTNNQHLNRKAFEDLNSFYNVLAEDIEEIYAKREDRVSDERIDRKPARINNYFIKNLNTISTDWLNQQAQTFVQPTSYELLLNRLRNEHFIQLHDKGHTGKFTASVIALMDLQVQEIYEWSTVNSLSEVLRYDIPEKSGVVLEAGADLAGFVGHVNEREIEKYCEFLKGSQSYFILISATSQPHRYFVNQNIAWEGASDSYNLLSTHISVQYANEDRQRMLAVLNRNDLISSVIFPRDCKSLIQKIELFIHGQLDEESFIASNYINTKNRISDWFADHSHYTDIAFYITLTLYENYPFARVMNRASILANKLLHYLQQEPKEASTLNRDAYLERFHAHVIRNKKMGYVGEAVEQEVVAYKYVDDKGAIWDHLWSQYPQYQPIIVEWLASIQREDKAMRKVIIGILVQLMSNYVEDIIHVVILKWLKSDNAGDRIFLISVLKEYARKDIGAANLVYQLINKWLSLKQYNMEWISAKLLGTHIAKVNFEESLLMLRNLYYSPSPNIRNNAKRSFNYITSVVTVERQYEEAYYQFWIEWIIRMDVDAAEVILMMTELFGQNLALFLYADTKYDKSFWLKYFLSCRFFDGKDFIKVRDATQQLSSKIYQTSKQLPKNEQRCRDFEALFSKYKQA
ncbi:hypothetical protein SY83_09400 [Paenibacillus swuensis]|uniref:TIR domain-containing protein n=1 Tax=Paenibacillus swuensis TaxID=1178515 RepID=A0A172THT5_9BACL|nr:toll/interleukin-1 receptor domain-containing protein [Paenibacillus swuensis]ANE46454.1 hypothetical protein SY83_09400 [Paenibacillus swuensis]